MSHTVEMNFDGLIGSTHNYAGLSQGNLASTNNIKLMSQPRQAAKEGLAKMLRLHQPGLKQGIGPSPPTFGIARAPCNDTSTRPSPPR